MGPERDFAGSLGMNHCMEQPFAQMVSVDLSGAEYKDHIIHQVLDLIPVQAVLSLRAFLAIHHSEHLIPGKCLVIAQIHQIAFPEIKTIIFKPIDAIQLVRVCQSGHLEGGTIVPLESHRG